MAVFVLQKYSPIAFKSTYFHEVEIGSQDENWDTRSQRCDVELLDKKDMTKAFDISNKRDMQISGLAFPHEDKCLVGNSCMDASTHTSFNLIPTPISKSTTLRDQNQRLLSMLRFRATDRLEMTNPVSSEALSSTRRELQLLQCISPDPIDGRLHIHDKY